MVINRKIRTKDNEIVNNYIQELEEELLRREDSSINKFIISANKVAEVFAKDLNHLAEGNEEMCILLTSDKDDKTVDRIMAVIKNTKEFKTISEIADSMVPEIINEAPDLQLKIDDETSSFEQVQKRIREKRAGNVGK